MHRSKNQRAATEDVAARLHLGGDRVYTYAGSMRVRVLYFGVLREWFCCSGEVVELAEGVAVGELLRVLRSRASNQAMRDAAQSSLDERLWRSLAVAVNREYSLPEIVLREGDEVALLPPVSGGSFAAKDEQARWTCGRYGDAD